MRILSRWLRSDKLARLEESVYIVKAALGPKFAIKQQRMIHPFPGKVVQPALTIMQIPERDTLDDIAIIRD